MDQYEMYAILWKYRLHMQGWKVSLQEIDDAQQLNEVRVDVDNKKITLPVHLKIAPKWMQEYLAEQMRLVKFQISTISAKRVYLRQFKDADLETLYAMNSDEESTNWEGIGACHNNREFLRRFQYLSQDPYNFAIALVDTDEIIGTMGIHPNRNRVSLCMEIGFSLSRTYRNQHYMSEMVQAVVNFLMDEMLCDQVLVRCFEGNVACQKVVEHCGFQYEGYMERSYQHEVYGAMGTHNYTITKEFWESGSVDHTAPFLVKD